MLLLMFRAGDANYAVDAKRVVEVVPRVEFRALPHAPPYLLGLLAYRGRVVPVIDFAVLNGRPPCREALSSRVILLELTTPVGPPRVLGLLAENVTSVHSSEKGQFVGPSMDLTEAPYLGAVLSYEETLVQLVVADKLLTGRMQSALYGSPEEPA